MNVQCNQEHWIADFVELPKFVLMGSGSNIKIKTTVLEKFSSFDGSIISRN
jgi:hypothetical protein